MPQMHLVVQKFFKKSITCTSKCVVPSLSQHETKPVLQCSGQGLCLESTGRSRRQERDQCLPRPVLLCGCPEASRSQVQSGKAGVIFFEGGTSTHFLHADSRALPQEDREFVEGVREVCYRS